MSKEKEEADGDEHVELVARKSPISGSGIARVHTHILNEGDFLEGKPVIIGVGKKSRVLRLVADDMMEEGAISLREKDMAKLKIEDGQKVELRPMKGWGRMWGRKIGFSKE